MPGQRCDCGDCKQCRQRIIRKLRRAGAALPSQHHGARTHCKHGHAFTAANTFTYVWHGYVKRGCRTCRNQRAAAFARKHRVWVRQYARNPDKRRDIQRARAAAKLTRVIEPVERAVVFALDHGLCGICGRPCDPGNFHVDHIQPLSRGGTHTYANCQPAHPRCNLSKGGH